MQFDIHMIGFDEMLVGRAKQGWSRNARTGLPEVLTFVPDRKPTPLSQADEFTLTLEFGAKAGRKLPGKIVLVLKADERTRLASTTTAAVSRPRLLCCPPQRR